MFLSQFRPDIIRIFVTHIPEQACQRCQEEEDRRDQVDYCIDAGHRLRRLLCIRHISEYTEQEHADCRTNCVSELCCQTVCCISRTVCADARFEFHVVDGIRNHGQGHRESYVKQTEYTAASDHHRDVVKRWKKGLDLVVLACEAQNEIHYAMPVRSMTQDGISYTEQIRLLWQQRKKERRNGQQTRKLTGEEYLSRFGKDDRIFPVITIVFYYDVKNWDGAADLYDMFGLDKLPAKEKTAVESFIPNYKINLIDAGNIDDITRFHTDLQQVFGMLKYRGEKEKLQRYMQENREYFGQVDVETYQALGAFLHSEKKLKEIVEHGEEEQIDMCKALDDIYADGEKAGRSQEKLIIITRMIKEGMSASVIRKCTQATDQEIEKARDQLTK